jgi:hypothetical protein
MSGYKCKACLSPAQVSDQGVITRSCGCNVGVLAEMSAVARGEGGASEGRLALFARWFGHLMEGLRVRRNA